MIPSHNAVAAGMCHWAIVRCPNFVCSDISQRPLEDSEGPFDVSQTNNAVNREETRRVRSITQLPMGIKPIWKCLIPSVARQFRQYELSLLSNAKVSGPIAAAAADKVTALLV